MGEAAGWLKIYRSLMDWEWYSDGPTKDIFIHFLLKANFVDGRWKGREIKRGSYVTSLSKISAETGLTVKQTRRAISNLKKSGEITSEGTTFTLVTVCNYDKYQDLDESEGHGKGTGRAQGGHRKGTGRATIEEVKEGKEGKKIKSSGEGDPDKPKTTVAEVIAYLNEKAGKRYSPKAAENIKVIKARVNEGRQLEDFKAVIDFKIKKWVGTEWETYLRPETLFGGKMDRYLNETIQEEGQNVQDWEQQLAELKAKKEQNEGVRN